VRPARSPVPTTSDGALARRLLLPNEISRGGGCDVDRLSVISVVSRRTASAALEFFHSNHAELWELQSSI
jgi:hypothetical protein